jgi:drug/metabolite transporter (DMT)-like permease
MSPDRASAIEMSMSHKSNQGQSPLALGYLFGATMALGAATSFAVARRGALAGLAPDDMVFARAVVAGLIMLPLFLRWGLLSLGGIGWRRGFVLLLTGGPLFALLQTGGYAFAPLAHGAVIAPSTVTILSTIGAVVLLGERLTRAHVIGGLAVITGAVLVSWHGIATAGFSGTAWIGDLMFVSSSVLWAAFTVLMRKWKIDPLRATAVVAVLTALVVLPVYFVYRGAGRLSALPLDALVVQGLAQGFAQGVITILAYTKAIAILGVSRAVLFPAVVPAISIVIGVPIVGEWPDEVQVAGLVVVTLGILTAVGAVSRLVDLLTVAAPRIKEGR